MIQPGEKRTPLPYLDWEKPADHPTKEYEVRFNLAREMRLYSIWLQTDGPEWEQRSARGARHYKVSGKGAGYVIVVEYEPGS